MKLNKKKSKHCPGHPKLPVRDISREVTANHRTRRPAPADVKEAAALFWTEFSKRVTAEPISRQGWLGIMDFGGAVIAFGLNPCNADPTDPLILDVTGWSKKKVQGELDLFFETLCPKCHTMHVTPEHNWTHGDAQFRDVSEEARDRLLTKLPVAADGVIEVDDPQEVLDAWQTSVQELIDEAAPSESVAAHITVTGGEKFFVAANPYEEHVLALNITGMDLAELKKASENYFASACRICAQLRAEHPQLQTAQ